MQLLRALYITARASISLMMDILTEHGARYRRVPIDALLDRCYCCYAGLYDEASPGACRNCAHSPDEH
jgi:hypothetical protein